MCLLNKILALKNNLFLTKELHLRTVFVEILDKVISDLIAKTNVASFLFMDKGVQLFLINSLMLLTFSFVLENNENIQKIKQKKNFILFIYKLRIYIVYLTKVIFIYIIFRDCKKKPASKNERAFRYYKQVKTIAQI
jgi:hypothetical protein